MSRWDCDAPLKSEWELANRRGQEAGDYDLAIAEYNEAIRLKPDFVAPHANLGTIYVCRGEWKKAIAKFSEALQLKPDDFSFYYIRANIYYRIGDYDEALTDYSAAIRLAPHSAGAFINRGLTYDRQGNHDKAVADYNQAIRLTPNMAYNDLARQFAICPDPKVRNGKKAVEYATKACELSQWKTPYYFMTLAMAYAEVGDFENAVKWQKKYVETNRHGDNCTEAHRILSLYEQKKPYQEAIS